MVDVASRVGALKRGVVESNTPTFVPKVTTMSPLGGVAREVHMDEPVAFMQEVYALNRRNSHRRRWQVIAVVRMDQLFGFWTDLGPVSDFETEIEGETYRQPMYQQPVAFAHNVGECLEMAELGRNDEYASKHLHEQTMNSTIHEQYRQVVEQDMKLIRNQSTFAATGGFKMERNDYSPTGKAEQQRKLEELNDYRQSRH